jgi:glycerate dehydrogenase
LFVRNKDIDICRRRWYNKKRTDKKEGAVLRVVILDGFTVNPGDLEWRFPDSFKEVEIYDRTPPELIVKRLSNADALLTNKTAVSSAVMDACPNLKYIGVLATGYNVVDVGYAKTKGITVTNIPSYSSDAVAQFTFALLLELCSRVGMHSDSVKAGEWSACEDFCYTKAPLTELAGKTMGIIGYGRIGKKVAAIALAFGMKVIAYCRSGKEVISDDNFSFGTLDEVFAHSDAVSLHTPLTTQTSGLICRESLKKMKRTAFLLNTARGGLIDDAQLFEALENGVIAGYGADVLTVEPPAEDQPLLRAKNTLITPHIAWAAQDTRKRLMNAAIENLCAFFDGRPQNTVV